METFTIYFDVPAEQRKVTCFEFFFLLFLLFLAFIFTSFIEMFNLKIRLDDVFIYM